MPRRTRARHLAFAAAVTFAAAAIGIPVGVALRSSAGAAVAPNFVDHLVIGGLHEPVNVEMLADGTVYVAEKAGVIKRFDGLADSSATIVADLSPEVNSFWDRGLLGLAVDPQFSSGRPYVYALFTFDATVGGAAPRWNDACPSPPGANERGCDVSGRLVRLTVGPTGTATARQVLVEDWCQQYPSHSIGDLTFLPDGSLAVSAGDGASFTGVDYGQLAGGANPCGDPAGEGGALRSQDVRSPADPTSLDGAILVIDPDTGVGRGAFAGDANAQRIYAHGFRNPVRMTQRPGTGELWVADVGWATHEEINVVNGGGNYGWPCYEGNNVQPAYADAALELCQSLPAGSARPPFFSYAHGQNVSADAGCGTNGQSISGITFYKQGSYPAEYSGALFFADYSRNCIWVMPSTGGVPDPSRLRRFVGDVFPVDLAIGPGGDLFYLDITSGLHRVVYAGGNQAPTPVIQTSVTSGPAPLPVTLDARATVDPTPLDIVTFAWDLDGDTQFDDATTAVASTTLTSPGIRRVGLRATDSYGASNESFVTITATSNGPVVTIDQPNPSLRWKVNDPITFSAHATDALDGTLPATAMSWRLVLHHCSTPTECHEHVMQTFDGVSQGSFVAPDHAYPAYLTLSVTARNSAGLSAAQEVRLDPATVDLNFDTTPSGLSLTVGETTQSTPFTKRSIVGSNLVAAAAPTQAQGGHNYQFSAWSDGGDRTHTITANAAATFTATYRDETVVPGNAIMERWSGFPGSQLDAIPNATAPTTTATTNGLSSPPDQGDEHGTHLRALIRPPATGEYTFWISSDDTSVLNLSSSADPVGRATIAASPAWTAPQDYERFASQRSNPIALSAGQSYFIEAWAKEGRGGDHLSVAWSGPGVAARQVVPDTALTPALAGACTGWCPIPPVLPPAPERPVIIDTWTGVPGSALNAIPDGTPAVTNGGLTEFRAPVNRGDQLGTRLRSLLVPPTSGEYTFWIAGDDESTLNLSPNEDPNARRRIASIPGWVGDQQFDVVASQRSGSIALVAGQRYYLEAWAKDGLGGDHLSVAWAGPGFGRGIIPTSVVVQTTTAPCGGGWCPAAPSEPPIESGDVIFETWADHPGFALDSIATGAMPSATATLASMQAPVNRGNALGTRLRTLVTAPASGDFTFWLASDDEGILNVSTSGDPTARVTVARVPFWSGPGSFDEVASQQSTPVPLVAGRKYYVEAWAKEGGGGDHLSVAWNGPGLGARTVIGGAAVSTPAAAPCVGWCPRPAVVTQGGVTFDSWENVPGFPLTAITAGTPPTAISSLSALVAPANRGAGLGTRLRALVQAPATGDYVFAIASDDQGVLALSENADPGGRRVIATVPFWSGQGQYTVYPSQKSSPIRLVAGQQYFIEAWAKDGGGADHLSVAWTPPGSTTIEAIPASALTATAAGCVGWCPPAI